MWLDRDGLTDSVVDNIEAELSLEEEVARLFWVTTVPTAGSANAEELRSAKTRRRSVSGRICSSILSLSNLAHRYAIFFCSLDVEI